MARYIDADELLVILNGLYTHHLTMYNYAADGATKDCIDAVIAAPAADVVPKSETASEIIDEIIDALQGEKDQEEKLGSSAWGESDTVGWHIHQYAEEKLDTLIIALSLYKREYTQEQNIGKTITVPKYKYTGN